MIWPTRRQAARARLNCERILSVYSQLERCELGCFCIRTPRRLIGYQNVMDLRRAKK